MTETVVLLIKTVVLSLLRIEMLLMFFRAILQWIPVSDKLCMIVEAVTEPLVAPVRRIVDRLMPKSATPIDISFIVTYMILYILELVIRFM